MEHVIKEARDGSRQVRLTAESGYLLKSKVSGKTYREIETLDIGRWTVIEDPEHNPAAEPTGTVAKTEAAEPSKPKTAKRTNRKGK